VRPRFSEEGDDGEVGRGPSRPAARDAGVEEGAVGQPRDGRDENFPLNTSVFTGRLPLERFRHERPREYKRLREEGRLEEFLTDPPSPRARLLASVFGYTAYLVGLVLIIAIFRTLLSGR
jgi:hypothetical protein